MKELKLKAGVHPTLSQWENIFSTCPKLEILEIYCCDAEIRKFFIYWSAVQKKLPKIKRISFRHYDQESTSCLQSWLKKLPGLDSLNYKERWSSLKSLCKVCENLQYLSSLDHHGNFLNDLIVMHENNDDLQLESVVAIKLGDLSLETGGIKFITMFPNLAYFESLGDEHLESSLAGQKLCKKYPKLQYCLGFITQTPDAVKLKEMQNPYMLSYEVWRGKKDAILAKLLRDEDEDRKKIA